MNKYLLHDEWKIIEEGLDSDKVRASESIFSLGNGKMGQRANFEEKYTGDSLQGSYIAGVYYPDKTRVGWWKNGYPEYFAKVLNSPNWIGINITIDEDEINLSKCKVLSFRRELNMKESVLYRYYEIETESGYHIQAKIERFLSIVNTEIGAIKYSFTILNKDAKVEIEPYIDVDIKNEDSNYNEKFWEEIERDNESDYCNITAKTKKLDFKICSAMKFQLLKNNLIHEIKSIPVSKRKYIGSKIKFQAKKGEWNTFYKYVAITSSLNFPDDKLAVAAKSNIEYAFNRGFEKLKEEHIRAWSEKWKESDITIEGDVAAQQAIRFNIFQLNQTYTGEDERLNIGPKGFTGEKYGGSTYWDTEAFCFPFYLNTADPKVARNLLLYRYKHLQKAIDNAGRLGFNHGAALYPMVTMNGTECHNEWEITFEEIHRNGAIAFAIYNYERHTQDYSYKIDFGLEVLISISRFWAQRVTFSKEKNQYVILGVTGPNEYENNVNNNWYTNKIATWTMQYTIDSITYVKENAPTKFEELVHKIGFDNVEETSRWKEIIEKMYFPFDEDQNVFLQQEGYMDKEQVLAKDLSPKVRPLNQNWSWDRILRSCFIKQADVVQGLYLFENEYDIETIKRNFYFYESRTVHESSLSPCIHSILASKIGDVEKAYDLYLRTSRLDLDDYNNEVDEGLHITSMAGTWLSVVEGFGGMRIVDGMLHFNPVIPEQWKSFSFKILFRGTLLKIIVDKEKIFLENQSEKDISLFINGNLYEAKNHQSLNV
jgi:maltose phosphorylase